MSRASARPMPFVAPRNAPFTGKGSPPEQSPGLRPTNPADRVPAPTDLEKGRQTMLHRSEVIGASQRIFRQVNSPTLGDDLLIHLVDETLRVGLHGEVQRYRNTGPRERQHTVALRSAVL